MGLGLLNSYCFSYGHRVNKSDIGTIVTYPRFHIHELQISFKNGLSKMYKNKIKNSIIFIDQKQLTTQVGKKQVI